MMVVETWEWESMMCGTWEGEESRGGNGCMRLSNEILKFLSCNSWTCSLYI
jgi:hypothetical protein